MHDERVLVPALVFVYGTLKTAGRLNIALREQQAEKVGDATVDGYTLREMADGRYPGAVPSLLKLVRGEVWKLPDSEAALFVLDAIEGVPWGYTREVVEVKITTVDEPSGSGRHEQAFMYVLAESRRATAGPDIGDYFEADPRLQQQRSVYLDEVR